MLLLTLDNPQLEEEVEYQIRELTLLPLNIKYLPLSDYLRGGAPQGITLVITLCGGAQRSAPAAGLYRTTAGNPAAPGDSRAAGSP
ncbi:hypothetical protein M8494_01890 [Serratia ureilytica]